MEAARKYHQALPGSPADEYLASRGLNVPEFKLGYVQSPYLGHEQFQGWLAIPYLRWSPERRGSVVSIRFRCIKDHDHIGHGKYMTVAGDKPRLFNTMALQKQATTIAITEGELDAITATSVGVPAVGVPGVSSWLPHFGSCFSGYREVLILADGDDAGWGFSNTLAEQLPNARVLSMPPGEDVNSFVLKHGPQAFKERVS